MSRLSLISLILSVMVLTIFGCSSNQMNPVTPESGSSSLIQPISVIDHQSAIGLFGAYSLAISEDGLHVEIVPIRTGALGESYIVSGMGFFTMTPCSDCLKMRSISLNQANNVVLEFAIKHPFPMGDPLKPATAKNRKDLDIFDIAMVVKPDEISPAFYSEIQTDIYPGVIANADGYTRELSDLSGDNSALPYKICYESANNNRFEMGTDYQTFQVEFIPGSGLSFELYLTMGYGAAAVKSTFMNPVYYIPEFNRKSAWKVSVTPPEGNNPPSVGNTWDSSDYQTEYPVTIDIYDWNHDATVADEYPDPDNTEQIRALSDVGSVSVEIPGMTSDAILADTSDTTSNGWDNPLTYIASIANENGLGVGEYTGLVKVTDTRIPSEISSPYTPDMLVHTPNGINLEWHLIPEFATYQTFTATVVSTSTCGPITGSITSPLCPVTGVTNGSSINFSATASSTNGGEPIVSIEWDMDYDGINFDVDSSGADVTLGPFDNPNCGTPPEDPVTYTVAVRATDSCVPPNITIFDTCEVTVDICGGISMGNLILTVNRLNTYAEAYRIDEDGPFTLEWTSAPGSPAEYAIYVDRDPSNGIDSNFILVDVETSTTFTAPPEELPSDHYMIGYTYIVRARSVVGEQSSEYAETELAHLIVTGFETQGAWTALNGEGWLANGQGTSTDPYTRPMVSGANVAHGSRSVHFSRKVGNPTTAGFWNGMVYGPIPVIPNSSVRFMDFSMLWRNLLDGGLCIGTSETQPYSGWTSPQDDFDGAIASDDPTFYGYEYYSNDICTYFNGCPSTGFNCWHSDIATMSMIRRRVGGDCNNLGDPSDQYVGIECYRTSIPDEGLSGDYTAIFLDEVAIAIY